MSTRTTLVLVVILAALSGYVWWSGRSSANSAATATPEALTIWTVEPAQVQAIVVEPTDQPAARVERDGDSWRIVAPTPGAADAETISRTLSSLATLEARRALTDTTDLAAYGLTSPVMTLRLETTSQPLGLAVGDMTPDSSAYYVQREGDTTVYLVAAYTLNAVKEWPTAPPLPPPPTPTFPPVAPTETPTAAASETPSP